MKTFLAANNDDCKFPIEGSGALMLVCGEPALPGGPYCRACHGRAYVPVTARALNGIEYAARKSFTPRTANIK